MLRGESMIKVSQKRLSSFYSSILAWTPLLSIYRSFIPGVSIAELLLALCIFFSIMIGASDSSGYQSSEKTLLFFAIYSCSVTIFAAFIGVWFEFNWINRVIRFTFYVFCIIYTSKKLFNPTIFFKSIFAFSIVLFFGMIFQYLLFYGTGKYVMLFGNFLPLTADEALNNDYNAIFSYSVFRPSSFLTEPSHIAQLEMYPFIYCLYKLKRNDKKYFALIIIIGLTIVLSKSLWGYVLVGIALSIWIFDMLKESHSIIWFLFMPIIIVVISSFLANSSLWNDTFSRIDFDNLEGSTSFSGRFLGYNDFLSLPLYRIIFGSGFGAVVNNRINNSILFILVGEGIIGIAILFWLCFKTIKKVNSSWKRNVCFVYIVLFFGSNVFFSVSVIILFTLLFDLHDPSKKKTSNSE